MTLIEIAVTLWIIAAVVVSMSSALFTVVKTSDIANRQAIADVELRHYAEAMREAPYIACASPQNGPNAIPYRWEVVGTVAAPNNKPYIEPTGVHADEFGPSITTLP